MEGPVDLREGAQVGRGIGLVAPQRALAAVLVDVAVAAVAHAVGLHPGGPQQRQAVGGGAPAPGQRAAAVDAIQVDDAAGRRRRGAAEPEPLVQVAGTAVETPGEAVDVGQLVLDHHARLRLLDVLAGVELGRRRHRLARVGVGLRAGQSERILRQRLVEVVELASHARAAGRLRHHACIELVAARRRVVAVAVGLVGPGIERAAQALVAAGQRHPGLPLAVRAEAGRRARGKAVLGRIGRKHVHHAARGIAVHLRKRATQHLDAAGVGEIGGGGLALAVGHGRGDAVDIEPHAAHTERGARAEAAHRQLQVLRIVLPVAHGHARHTRQHFGQIDQRRGAAQRIDWHAVDRSGCVEAALLAAGGGNHDVGKDFASGGGHRTVRRIGGAYPGAREQQGGQRQRPRHRFTAAGTAQMPGRRRLRAACSHDCRGAGHGWRCRNFIPSRATFP
ncbi:hypothetical protein D9M72_424320 [compost metagenome]